MREKEDTDYEYKYGEFDVFFKADVAGDACDFYRNGSHCSDCISVY